MRAKTAEMMEVLLGLDPRHIVLDSHGEGGRFDVAFAKLL